MSDSTPETPKKRPASWEQVARTLAWLSPTVSTMLKVQWLTGMRSSELVLLRPCDIDTTGPVWVYAPLQNKNDWRENPPKKLICLGPRVQRLLRRYCRHGTPDMNPGLTGEAQAFYGDPERFIFRPAIALAEQ